MKIHELGHIVFYVTNLNRSIAFYRDTLGFTMITEGGGFAVFSGGRTHHEMLLIEVGGVPRKKSGFEPGLYHVGFKIGEGKEALQEVYTEIKEKGVTIVGSADHTVTHSLYILDPDGNELELYADVSDTWKTNPEVIMSPTKPLKLG